MNYPIKVLQFGEGNFLRAFVDYMIDYANRKNVFNGKVIIIKPIPMGSLETLKKQSHKYTLLTRGIINGRIVKELRSIDSIADSACAYSEYDRFMSFSHLEELEIIISNTTEAGIVYGKDDRFEDCPPKDYPSKLTKFLFERFTYFNGRKDKGLYILPCELIEDNARKLEECVHKTIKNWMLPESFSNWVSDSCVFCNTLVDRIVTGYPKDEISNIEKELGIKDELLDVCEPFALWVIEDKKDIKNVLPLDKANLEVIFTDDITPYRERKVKILNGAHTITVLAAFLSGKKIVRECMQDTVISSFMKECIYNEVMPTLSLDHQELVEFTESVFERFSNPFIDHRLLSIALNSVSKWKARVLCSFKDYYSKFNELPLKIVFSFAALMAFYMGNKINNTEDYSVCDDQIVLDFFNTNNERYMSKEIDLNDYILDFASNTDFWGEDLTQYEGFTDLVFKYLSSILEFGSYEAMKILVTQ